MGSKEIMLYVHYPFCESKCEYCDFNSHVTQNLPDFDDLYLKELNYYVREYGLENRVLRSIFFGGGTPSLMNPNTVAKIINRAGEIWNINPGEIEISLEANPSSTEVAKFEGFKNAGVNRVSLGIQSMVDSNLKFLTRRHSANEARKAIETAQKVFGNSYSCDFMYALEGQSLNDWETELKGILSDGLLTSHASLYCLTIEKGTLFYQKRSKGEIVVPDDFDGEFYYLTDSIMKSAGFERYEISNYCKAGFECIHNTGYWSGVDYIGIGAGAHGRITTGKHQRIATMNHSIPSKWSGVLTTGEHSAQYQNTLPKTEIVEEALITNLRYKGICKKDFHAKYNYDIMDYIDKKSLIQMQNNGLLKDCDDWISPTEKGYPLVSSIAIRLLGTTI